jgi:type VI secretion system protein ImpE
VNAHQLVDTGKLDEAITLLGAEVRKDPTNTQWRTFLFELLCFAGDHDRAEKQLGVLAAESQDAGMGALLYRSALHADRTRQRMFSQGEYPRSGRDPPPIAGKLNGTPFESLQDADPRVGARLEVFAAGEYMWIPLEHVTSVQVEPPRRLRDLLWIPAVVRGASALKGFDFGEVLLPAMAPLTWQHPDGEVRLGRVTEWAEVDDGAQVPVGQKLLLVDGHEFPILELRELEITPPSNTAD